MAYRLDFTDDPAALLAVAGEHLAADPVVGTVVATSAARAVAARDRGATRPSHPEWWVAVLDDADRVVGVAMRTAPFAPYPLYVMPMPDDAARALAAAVVDRGEVVPANGALPAARTFTEEVARLTGGAVRVSKPTRLFELRTLVPPRVPTGRLRPARPEEAELCLRWFRAFSADADAQAGRRPEPGRGEHFDLDQVAERVALGCVHLWETPGGGVVHLTGANPPAYGVVRIGPVYTPTEHRGAGYASAAVAEVSRRALAAGHRPCLFTDLDNPTSNRIYEAIGYEKVMDTAEHALVPDGG